MPFVVQVLNKTVEVTWMVREADIKRGWGKYYSKSCKAVAQERRTHQHSNYKGSGVNRDTFLHYANEYGGTPHFDRSGEYIGFSGRTES